MLELPLTKHKQCTMYDISRRQPPESRDLEVKRITAPVRRIAMSPNGFKIAIACDTTQDPRRRGTLVLARVSMFQLSDLMQQ